MLRCCKSSWSVPWTFRLFQNSAYGAVYLVRLFTEHAVDFAIKLGRFDFLDGQVSFEENGFVLVDVVRSVSSLEEFGVVVLLVGVELGLRDDLGIETGFLFAGFALDDVIGMTVLFPFLFFEVDLHAVADEPLPI